MFNEKMLGALKRMNKSIDEMTCDRVVELVRKYQSDPRLYAELERRLMNNGDK